MSKVPKYKGITTQWIYTTKLIDKFIESRQLGNLMIEQDIKEIVFKSLEHHKRLRRAYDKTHKKYYGKERQKDYKGN